MTRPAAATQQIGVPMQPASINSDDSDTPLPLDNTWETTPIFWHSANVSGPIDSRALDFLTTHKPAMITLEKSTMLNYLPLNSSGEKKVLLQSGWIKQAFAKKGLAPPAVLFYTNLAQCVGTWRRPKATMTCTPGSGPFVSARLRRQVLHGRQASRLRRDQQLHHAVEDLRPLAAVRW
jgi:hypothetical protein